MKKPYETPTLRHTQLFAYGATMLETSMKGSFATISEIQGNSSDQFGNMSETGELNW